MIALQSQNVIQNLNLELLMVPATIFCNQNMGNPERLYREYCQILMLMVRYRTFDFGGVYKKPESFDKFIYNVFQDL